MKAYFISGDRTSLCVRSAEDGPAFTLIELAVVIGVIALLAATLLPALASTRFRTRMAMCVANCRQWGVAMTTYSSDHNNYFPDETLPATAGGDVWDVADSYLTDMAHYGMNNPELWFCPVRAWTYPAVNAWCLKTLGHPLENVTNDVARCFAYSGAWPNPAFENLASGGIVNGAVTTAGGYEPWTKRLWEGVNPPKYMPSIYVNGTGGTLNPNRNSPYDWLLKSSDPHAAHVPILTDIAIGLGNNRVLIASEGVNAVLPGQGHPAGCSQNGAIESADLVFGDGHVETHWRNEIHWRYIGILPYTSFY